jgi:hypothetical protein
MMAPELACLEGGRDVPPIPFRRPPEPPPPHTPDGPRQWDEIRRYILTVAATVSAAMLVHIGSVLGGLPLMHAELKGENRAQNLRLDALSGVTNRFVTVLERNEEWKRAVELRLDRLERK